MNVKIARILRKITLLYLTYAHISIICCHYLERSIVASGIDKNSIYRCLMTAVFYSSLCYTKVIEGLGKSSSWVNNSIWSSVTGHMKRKAQNKMAPVINISNNKVHHCITVAKLQLPLRNRNISPQAIRMISEHLQLAAI